MADKKIIINNVDVSGCECYNQNIKMDCLLHPLQSDACKNNPNCHYKLYKRKEKECEKAKQNAQDTYDLWQALIESFNILQGEKIKLEQECEELRKKLKPKLKNAYCAYFDGQTGWCKAKEFIRCNPIGCKLYTIDELSTIVDLQQQLDQLKKQLESTKGLVTVGNKQLAEALKENKELKKILHYPKYRNEEGIKELKTKSIDYLIEEIVGNHQYMEGKSQAVYKPMLIENKKLKQTLAEIKEIAEQISLPMGTGKSGNRVILAKQILQKISECEVENER